MLIIDKIHLEKTVSGMYRSQKRFGQSPAQVDRGIIAGISNFINAQRFLISGMKRAEKHIHFECGMENYE